MDTIFITYRLDSYQDDIREWISSICGRRVSLQHCTILFVFGWLFSRGRFGGGAIISEHPVLPSSEGSKAQSLWIFLICLPYTLHSKMNTEPKKWTFGRWFILFPIRWFLGSMLIFRSVLSHQCPTQNNKKHIDDVSGKQPMRRTMPCRTNWLLALASLFHLYIHHAQKPKQFLWWQNWRHLKSETPIDFNQKSVQRSLNRIFWSLFFKQLQCSWVAAIH